MKRLLATIASATVVGVSAKSSAANWVFANEYPATSLPCGRLLCLLRLRGQART